MKVHLRKKASTKTKSGYSYYLDYVIDGIRKTEYLNLKIEPGNRNNPNIKLLAETLRNDKELLINSANFSKESLFHSKINLLAFVLQRYEESQDINYRSLSTHLRDFNPNLILAKVNYATTLKFIDHLKAKLKLNSVRAYIALFKAIFHEAERRGLCDAKFLKKLPSFHVPPPERPFLTSEEIVQLIGTPTKYPEIKRIFLFGIFTGLRKSDILNLKYENIIDGSIKIVMKKTGKTVVIPITENIKYLIKPEGYVLPMPGNFIFEQMSYTRLSRHLIKLFKEANLPPEKAFPHCSRHSFAVSAITSGVDIFSVQNLLGHTSLQHTQIYAKIVESKLKAEMAKMPIYDMG